MPSQDLNYEAIPLFSSQADAAEQLRSNQQLFTRRLSAPVRAASLLLCSIFILNVFFSYPRPSKGIETEESATAVFNPARLAGWRSSDVKEICINVLESPSCKPVDARSKLCETCIETLPCEIAQGFCSNSSGVLEISACNDCQQILDNKTIAREPKISTQSTRSEEEELPMFSPETELVELEDEKAGNLTDPSTILKDRFSLLQLCQSMRDTEAFCLEETLDQQLCEPCSYCALLRREKVCAKRDYAGITDCIECGIVSISWESLSKHVFTISFWLFNTGSRFNAGWAIYTYEAFLTDRSSSWELIRRAPKKRHLYSCTDQI